MEKKQFRCPKCGSMHFTVIAYPDYRATNLASYTLRCNDCRYVWDEDDPCTG